MVSNLSLNQIDDQMRTKKLLKSFNSSDCIKIRGKLRPTKRPE